MADDAAEQSTQWKEKLTHFIGQHSNRIGLPNE